MVAARLPPEPQVSRSPSLPLATVVHPGRVAPSPVYILQPNARWDVNFLVYASVVCRCLTSWCLVGSLVLFHD